MGLINEILNLVTDCLNAMLFGMFLYGTIGLIAGVILMFAGRRFGFFSRKSRLLRILVIIYYVYVPLVFALAGVCFGGVSEAEKCSIKQVSLTIAPNTESFFPSYQLYLTFNWDRIETENLTFEQTMNEYLAFIEYAPKTNEWWEKKTIEIANDIVPQIAQLGIGSVVVTARNYAEKQPEILKINESETKKALVIAKNLNIEKCSRDFWDAVEVEIMRKVRLFYKDIYSSTLLYLLCLMLLPILETVAHLLLCRKKSA